MALSGFTTKLALKKAGIPSDTFDFDSWSSPVGSSRQPNKLKKRPPLPSTSLTNSGFEDSGDNSWAAWMASWNVRSLPITVHPWFSPPPPPVQIARTVPNVGDTAPMDRSGRLRLGGGRKCLVVFLRCVGCACSSRSPLSPRYRRRDAYGNAPKLTEPVQSPRKRSSTSAP